MDTLPAPLDPAFSAEFEYKSGEIVFDDYVILGKVGAGAMGIVYKAKNTVLNRMVALKVLPRSISANAVMRFQNEARALGRLQNDKIASVFDLNTKNGTTYLAMQFIEGLTLDQLLLKKKALPLDEFISIFRTICEALAHAHARDVIHRDIKPSNIILEDRDGKLTPVIVDFGVAKLQDVDGRLTQSGSCIGTPLYASPEQAQAKPTSDRSDMYSLGCLMFHCLVGVPPFQGDSAMSTLAMHVNEEPPFQFLKARTDLPEEIFLLVQRLLEKDPLKRPSADQTRQLLSDESIAIPHVDEASAAPEKPDDEPMRIHLVGASSLRAARRGNVVTLFFAAIALVATFFLSCQIIPFLTSRIENSKPINSRSFGGETATPKLQKSNLKSAIDRFTDGNFQLRGGDFAELTDEQLKVFETMPPERVSLLQLSDNIDLTDSGLTHLKNLRHLKTLKIAGTKAKRLDYLEGMTELKVLDLSATMIDNESMYALKGLTKLDRLFLKETKIDDLSFLIQFPNLTELNLELSRNIEDQSLDPILSLKHLHYLTLSSTNISDVGLMKLAALRSLTQVNVNDCQRITEDGVTKIERLLPSCSFNSDTPSICRTTWNKANEYVKQEQYDQAIAMYKTTVQVLKKENRLTPPLLTRAMCGIADAELKAGRPENSADAAIVAAKNAQENHLRKRIARLMDKLQIELYRRHKSKRANACMKAIGDLYAKLGDDASLNRSTNIWSVYVQKLLNEDELSQAMKECSRRMDTMKGLGMEESEMAGKILSLKAAAELYSDDIASARNSYKSAIRQMETTSHSHCPQALIGSYHGLAIADSREGKLERAITYERKAIQLAHQYNIKHPLPDLNKHLKGFINHLGRAGHVPR